MAFESILDLKHSTYREMSRAVFSLDLNLNQIMEQINQLWGEDVSSLYYFPADEECEAYRRAVFADVKKPDIYEALAAFCDRMKDRQKCLAEKQGVRADAQKAVWHLREVHVYCCALEELDKRLKAVSPESEGLLALREDLSAYLASEEYVKMHEPAQKLAKELFDIRVTITYENNQIVVSDCASDRTYEKFLREGFPEHKADFHSPFMTYRELTPLESEVMKVLAKKRPDFFKQLMSFYKNNQKYAAERYVQLNREAAYYLSFVKFLNKMKGRGFLFTTPRPCERSGFRAQGLYDLALACVNMQTNKPVVSNDFDYREGEQFFVLTGPNQGGKTTFARSLGQLIYFSKLGFDVPAAVAHVPYFKHILTHFSVEESLETGRGKLKEELARLAPMMDSVYENTFVIINELFTTAANYDACIMGKNVLEHFIGQNCMGIYVTHLKELTTAHEKVVSLRAMLDENRVQCFKIVRGEADDSACAINQVNKYKLTYEQLKERLS